MASDDERNPLDALKPGDLDALTKPAEPADEGPELSGQLGDVTAPWVGAEESWRQGSEPAVDEPPEPAAEPAESGEDDDELPADLPLPEGARLSDIDATSAARAAASLPPPKPRKGKPGKGLFIFFGILILVGTGATLWLLDLRDEYRHQQTLKNIRDRDDSSARLRLASLLFGAEEEAPEPADPPTPAPADVPNVESGSAGEEAPDGARKDSRSDEDRPTKPAEECTDTAAVETGTDDAPSLAEPGATAAEGDAPEAEAAAPPDQLSALLAGADTVAGEQIREERAAPAEEKVIVLEGEQFKKLPEQPSRAQVKSAMDAVAGAVKRCGQGGEGRILIRIQVTGITGRVAGAQVVSSEHQGTSIATCATRAVRAAKFPRFAKDSISIKYPFDL